MISPSAKSYRGVSCHRCGDPIPVSAKVAALHENENAETDVPHTFIERCKLCEFEDVYLVSAIKTFEGEQRRSAARA
jgi:hypothetical protein